MKSILKSLPIFLVLSTIGLGGCNNKEVVPPSTFEYASYENIATLDEEGVDQYISLVDNDARDNGIITCPYHTMKVNGVDVPLYGTRTANGIHSFAYLHVNEDKVNLSVEITSTVKKFSSVEVLPLSSNIKGSVSNNVTTATIDDFGSFSFAFNKKSNYPVTIMVVKKTEFVLPSGYNLVELAPKEMVDNEYPVFTDDETNFTAGNTAYYFKKGHYKIHSIKFPSNSVFYFEPGTYLEDYLVGDTLEEQKADYTAFMHSTNAKNIKIYGNPLVDYSCHWGGPANHKSKGHYSFTACENVDVNGMIFINASSWQLCHTNCTNVEIQNCMLFGYRTCSDGIMLADCKHGHIHHNFVRTGDDAIEAKSTGSQGGEDLLYEYNAVWSDKARCYGVIYESNRDAHNIIFRNNSIGFSQAAWTDDVGCLAIILGTNKSVMWSDIHFEDTEIYSLKSHALCLSLCGTTGSAGGNAQDIYFKNTTVHCKFISHEELLYVRVEENCSLKKVFVENLQYIDSKSNMVKFKPEDLNNNLMTEYWSADSVKITSIVEVK